MRRRACERPCAGRSAYRSVSPVSFSMPSDRLGCLQRRRLRLVRGDFRLDRGGRRARQELAHGSGVCVRAHGQQVVSRAKLTAAHGVADPEFGYSVAISASAVVVGAPSDANLTDPGAAYVFVRSGTGWSRQAKLAASDPSAGDDFGFSVATSGSTVVVGAYGTRTRRRRTCSRSPAPHGRGRPD